VILVGKEMFAIMGRVYDTVLELSKAFTCKVEVPALEDGIDTLFGIKVNAIPPLLE
jgi:hypothetical protein